MGDMADWITDNELATLDDHRRGDCEAFCRYCEEEEAAKRRRKRKAAAPARREGDG